MAIDHDGRIAGVLRQQLDAPAPSLETFHRHFIYEAFPLARPICHAQMRIISFVTDASTVRKILDHIGESTQPPRIAPARGPPLWEAAMAHPQAGNDHQ